VDIIKFSNDLETKLRELHILVQRDIPRVIGVEAKEHFIDNFRKGGFVNHGLQPWQDVNMIIRVFLRINLLDRGEAISARTPNNSWDKLTTQKIKQAMPSLSYYILTQRILKP
jgi:hypothetical protein